MVSDIFVYSYNERDLLRLTFLTSRRDGAELPKTHKATLIGISNQDLLIRISILINAMSLSLLATGVAAAQGHAAPESTWSRNLNGEAWRVVSPNGTIDVATNLPAVAHTALMAAGVLKGDPVRGLPPPPARPPPPPLTLLAWLTLLPLRP